MTIFFISGNSGLYIRNGFFYRTTDGGLNWIERKSGPFVDFKQIRVADDYHAIAASTSGIYLTTDNGESWAAPDPNSTYPAYSMNLLALSGTSYFVGKTYITWEGRSFSGMKSSDFGRSWQPVQRINKYFNSISFGSDSSGYLGGYHQGMTFAKSGDKGFTWTAMTGDMNPFAHINSVFFLNDTLGWIAADGVIKTTDGGLHWSKPALGYIFIQDVYFFDKDNGWMFSDNLLIRSSDGGENWMGLSINTGSDILKRVVFINKEQGYLLTDKNMFKTTDGGTKWMKMENIPIPLSGMNDMVKAKDNSIWICGDKGLILRFMDTISNADTTNIPVSPDHYFLSQNYPNPFNPDTKINYTLPASAYVTLKVFDMLGNEVATLVNEIKTEGIYTEIFNAGNLSSGMYVYQLQAGNFRESRKMMVLR